MSDNNNLLLEGILSDSKKDSESILAEARESADALMKTAEEKAEHDAESERSLFDLKLKQLDLKLESDKRSLERVYSLKKLDAAYEKIMERVSSQWEKEIASPAFRDTLVNWIAEAAIGLNLATAKVAFNPKAPVDEQMLRKAETIVKDHTNSSLTLTLDEVGTPECGVVVSSLDSKISYSNLISVRTRRFHREIKEIVQDYTCEKAE
jgi:hypothetical protein